MVKRAAIAVFVLVSLFGCGPEPSSPPPDGSSPPPDGSSPHRSSPHLVSIAPLSTEEIVVLDDADADPAWFQRDGAVWTRAGRSTDPIPVDAPAALRAFEDGTVIACGMGALARWTDGAWMVIPFPADVTGSCRALAADSPTDAWFAVQVGNDATHLCIYDGIDIVCSTAGWTQIAMGLNYVFLARTYWTPEDSETEIHIVARGALPAVEGYGYYFSSSLMRAVPGADEVIVDDGYDVSPVVLDAAGSERWIGIATGAVVPRFQRYISVPMASGDTFVVRHFERVTYCGSETRSPGCAEITLWSVIVVERDLLGELTEVAHYERSGATTLLRALRVDDGILIETSDGWLGLP